MAGKSQRIQQRLARMLNLNTQQYTLGDGQGRVFAEPGMVYVRQRMGMGENGTPIFGVPFMVRSNTSANYYAFNGAAVTLERDKAGNVQVSGTTWDGAIAQGLDPNVLNPANVFVQQERVTNIAKNHIDPDTQAVGANQLFYVDTQGRFQAFDLSASQMVDLTAYEPAGAGTQKLVLTYIALDNQIAVIESTAKPITQLFDFDDIDEVVSLLPPTAIPLGAWRVQNGQTEWRQTDLIMDMRQWINTPQNITVRASNPTVTNDDTEGFTRGCLWVNGATDDVYICADNATGAAVWAQINGGGGGGGFDVTDGTDTETVSTLLEFNGSDFQVDDNAGTPRVNFIGTAAANINVEEAGTPVVTSISAINFVSGATVADGGGGLANVTITGGGGLQITQGATDINPATQLVIGSGITLTEPSAGVASIAAAGATPIYPEFCHLHHHAATVTSGAAISFATFNLFEYRGYWGQITSLSGNEWTQSVFLREGLYEFKIMGLRGPNSGILEIYIGSSLEITQDRYNGSNIGVVDTFTNITIPSSGVHVMTGRVNGKNPSAGLHQILLNAYWFKRTGNLL